MAAPNVKEKLNKVFFLLSVIIIIILAFLLFQKRFKFFLKKAPFSLKLVRIIGAKYNLKGPVAVSFGRKNDIYVVDSGNSRIIKFNINGIYLSQWGIEGKATGEFMVPLYAVAYGSPKRIYVVDSGNSRIQIFKPNGEFVSEFGASKNSKRILTEPTFIGFAYNKIYVANSGADDIIIYFKNGQFYERIGNATIRSSSNKANSGLKGKKGIKRNNNSRVFSQSSSKPIALKKPVSIAFSKKYIYVSDYGVSKILVFNRQFDYIGSIGIPGEKGYQLYHPVGIVYKKGYLFVANYGRSILTVFKLENGYDVVKSYNFGTPGVGGRNFNHESNISISANGEYMAAADTNNNRVLIYRIFGLK